MNQIRDLGDIRASLRENVIGIGHTGGIGTTNVNRIAQIKADGTRKVNSKLFNQLAVMDSTTSARVQPFVGGRCVIIIGQMPAMMQRLHPEACAYMKILFTSTVTGVSGFEDNTLEVETVQALTEQNNYQVITKAGGNTTTLTLTFMTMFQGLPIYRFITTWMNYIQNRGSGVSSYPHLTERTAGGALEYHEGNHSMTMMYIIPDPSMRFVEEGAFCYSMVPTSNNQSQVLEAEWGSAAPKTLQQPFKVSVITAAHAGVRQILQSTLRRWTQDVALDDNQVIVSDITGGELY